MFSRAEDRLLKLRICKFITHVFASVFTAKYFAQKNIPPL